jgi:ribosomal protein S8
MLGQPIYKINLEKFENYFELKTEQTKTGIYIVTLKTKNGVMSKKVMIK